MFATQTGGQVYKGYLKKNKTTLNHVCEQIMQRIKANLTTWNVKAFQYQARTQGERSRTEKQNSSLKQMKKPLSWESNSEQSIQEMCGDREAGTSQLHSQRFDGWTSFPCNHFHHLKMVGVKLRVGGAFILSIDLIRTKWATVFSLKMKRNKLLMVNTATQHLVYVQTHGELGDCLKTSSNISITDWFLPRVIDNLLLHKILWEMYKERAKQGAVLTVTLASALGDIQNGKLI